MSSGGVTPGEASISGIWISYDDVFYYSRGLAPDGTPRLAPLTQPPHGKTVWTWDPTTAQWSPRRLPWRPQPAALFTLALGAALCLLVLVLLTDQDPIMWRTADVVIALFTVLIAILAQTAHLHPHDEISLAQDTAARAQAAAEADTEAAARHAQAATRAQAALQQQLAAQWAQLAQINATINPGQDVWRPYGRSPN